MEFRQLGNSDLSVSSIGLGSVTFGREIDAETSFSILDYAMDRDINFIDTAEVYSAGGSEKVLGQWLSRSSNREKVVLGTKIVPPLGRERILQVAEDSLRRLQTDVIDLYQPHAYDASTPPRGNDGRPEYTCSAREGALPGMQQLRRLADLQGSLDCRCERLGAHGIGSAQL